MIPAQEAPWNAVVPQWVKDNDDAWLSASHDSSLNGGLWGKFGYTSATGNVDPYVDRSATTPSGLVQLSFVDKTTADPRWMRSERWIAENWDTGENWLPNGASRNLYAMYAMTKAMRLAKPTPVVNFAINGFDWYRGNASHNGVAKVLSDNIIANGYYNQSYWEGNPRATAWAVIMLKPALFAASPIACFTAHPNPSFSDQDVSFDPSCSGHSDPAKSIANIVKFEWDWDNDGTYDQNTATPDVVTHSFHCNNVPCTFPVKLKVTDDAGLTATFALDIHITDPPHPPVSNPGGPYVVSLCANDTLKLDGSASYDPDEGLHQSGCGACPNDTVTAWDWDLDGAPFTYTSASGNVVDLGTGFTTYFPSAGSYDIGLKVTDNTALAYPDSGDPDLTDEAFAVVNVYNPGPCDLTATPGCQSIHLEWNDVAADDYDVYRSSTGPNSGFSQVGTTSGLTYDDPIAFNQHVWYRIVAKTGQNVSMSPAVSVIDAFTDCACISDMVSNAKNLLVQLSWSAVSGADCYNVYRSMSPGVPVDSAHRIAECIGVPYSIYVDQNVVNDTTYYYVITEVVNGEEVCISNEVSGTPTQVRRRR